MGLNLKEKKAFNRAMRSYDYDRYSQWIDASRKNRFLFWLRFYPPRKTHKSKDIESVWNKKVYVRVQVEKPFVCKKWSFVKRKDGGWNLHLFPLHVQSIDPADFYYNY